MSLSGILRYGCMDVYYGSRLSPSIHPSINNRLQTAIVGRVGLLVFMLLFFCLAACSLKLYCWGKKKLKRKLMHSQDQQELEEVISVPMLGKNKKGRYNLQPSAPHMQRV